MSWSPDPLKVGCIRDSMGDYYKELSYEGEILGVHIIPQGMWVELKQSTKAM